VTGMDIDQLEATALKGVVGDPLPAYLSDLALWEQESVDAIRALASHTRHLADALREVKRLAPGTHAEAIARAALDRHTHPEEGA
jgi:hypothetical protein